MSDVPTKLCAKFRNLFPVGPAFARIPEFHKLNELLVGHMYSSTSLDAFGKRTTVLSVAATTGRVLGTDTRHSGQDGQAEQMDGSVPIQ